MYVSRFIAYKLFPNPRLFYKLVRNKVFIDFIIYQKPTICFKMSKTEYNFFKKLFQPAFHYLLHNFGKTKTGVVYIYPFSINRNSYENQINAINGNRIHIKMKRFSQVNRNTELFLYQ